jgi:hypothetical protein
VSFERRFFFGCVQKALPQADSKRNLLVARFCASVGAVGPERHAYEGSALPEAS